MSGMTDAALRLVRWFRANARELPWRTEPRDGYAALVAELMAQQTQLNRVAPKFVAFMDRFPTIDDLAAAAEDEVLEHWSGLGYYRRARLLHQAAQQVSAAGGTLPDTAAELERLPGIGPYTAAAIASLVHGEATPVIDGNVARVGGRVLGCTGDPRVEPDRSAILAWVERLFGDGVPPDAVNEGLMELGALVCTPVAPDCQRCPLAAGCRARRAGDPERYPPPRRGRSPIRLRWVAAVIVDCDGRWLLRRIDEGPILKGLWLPPVTEVEDGDSAVERAAALVPFVGFAAGRAGGPVRHAITHRRIEVHPVRFAAGGGRAAPPGWRWARPATPGLPTSSLLAKLHRSIGE